MRIHINPISNHKYDYDIYDSKGKNVESFPSASAAVNYVLLNYSGRITVTYGKPFIAGDKQDQISYVKSFIASGQKVIARCK